MGADLRSHTSQLAILALILAWGSGGAQNSTPVETDKNSGAAVRLEAHDGQTHFKIGDPVVLDLVFTSRSPRYVVNIDTTPYLPVSDLVELAPKDGWVRSHGSFRGKGQNVSALANLRSSPIRVPVLLNRTITFQEPGHYEVTLTTERLRTSDTWMYSTSLETCDPCRTTNAVGIDLSARDESEEAALVVSLSRGLEETKSKASASELAREQKEERSHEIDAQIRRADSTEASRKQTETLLRKLNDMASNRLAAIQKQEDAQREAAVRLAYLAGDDAVRAKVHFIADEREDGEANPIGPIMRDGLASSRNKQLQLTLLEAAWRDPHRVPTSELQAALRQAKELMQKQMVTDEATLWAGTAEERQTALEEYQAEVNEIIATLPLRTESNRTETIVYLGRSGSDDAPLIGFSAGRLPLVELIGYCQLL
jgi:hypothetical protein